MDILNLKRNKRRKLLITVGFSYVTLLMVPSFHSLIAESPAGIAYALSVLFYLGIGIIAWWSIDGGKRYVQSLFAILPLLIYSLLTHSMILMFTGGEQVVVFTISAFGFYILLLSINILFISHEKRIPLQKAALSTLYFIGMVLFIAFGLVMILKGWGIMAFLLRYWLLILLFCVSFIHLVSDKDLIVESFIVGIISIELLGLVLLWPAQPALVVVAYVGWVFILLGVIQHHIEKVLSPARYTEFILLAVILLLAYALV